ncbi:hypothetical protein D3C81_1440510 [compost metagenome]
MPALTTPPVTVAVRFTAVPARPPEASPPVMVPVAALTNLALVESDTPAVPLAEFVPLPPLTEPLLTTDALGSTEMAAPLSLPATVVLPPVTVPLTMAWPPPLISMAVPPAVSGATV